MSPEYVEGVRNGTVGFSKLQIVPYSFLIFLLGCFSFLSVHQSKLIRKNQTGLTSEVRDIIFAKNTLLTTKLYHFCAVSTCVNCTSA
jgi:hypothetical protein